MMVNKSLRKIITVKGVGIKTAGGGNEKRPKIALLSLFQERATKKGRKIALLGLYLLYLYHVSKFKCPVSWLRCQKISGLE